MSKKAITGFIPPKKVFTGDVVPGLVNYPGIARPKKKLFREKWTFTNHFIHHVLFSRFLHVIINN